MIRKHLPNAEIIFKKNKFYVSGHLDFSNVLPLYQKSLSEFNKSSALEFDFSESKSSNSAGLALIIEWVKLAKRKKKSICFSHVSEKLMLIANISGLDKLINRSCDMKM